MNYGNLAQTGAVAATGVAGMAAVGSWFAVATVAIVVGGSALYRLVTPSAKARP